MYENKILNEVEKEVVKYLREINTINGINKEELEIKLDDNVGIALNDISELENILQHIDRLNPVKCNQAEIGNGRQLKSAEDVIRKDKLTQIDGLIKENNLRILRSDSEDERKELLMFNQELQSEKKKLQITKETKSVFSKERVEKPENENKTENDFDDTCDC